MNAAVIDRGDDLALPDAPTWEQIKQEVRDRTHRLPRKDYAIVYVHFRLIFSLRKDAPRDEWVAAQKAALDGIVDGATFAIGRAYFVSTDMAGSYSTRCYVWKVEE